MHLLKIGELSLSSQNKLLSKSKVENEFSKFGLLLTSITVQKDIQYQNCFCSKEENSSLMVGRYTKEPSAASAGKRFLSSDSIFHLLLQESHFHGNMGCIPFSFLSEHSLSVMKLQLISSNVLCHIQTLSMALRPLFMIVGEKNKWDILVLIFQLNSVLIK